MSYPIKSPKKLIEVALPLDAINEASAREKSIRHGHPSTLHLWWARRPLAAARAVIFAQLVNDPGYQQGQGFKYGVNKQEAAKKRKELFKIIEDLVQWENTTNEAVLERARAEIRRSWREVCELNKDHPRAAELFNPDKMPALHDPFAGGGAIPLEAQRLGLEAYASDLNPVPVLINKAMIEIPPRFAGKPPVNPASVSRGERSATWKGATGLADDVRYYGAWMRAEAEKRIGHLYPPVEITAEMASERPDLKPLVGQKLTVIAWIWARTVKSPNPAFSHVEVPLASNFLLSTKAGKEAYVQPIVEGDKYRFAVIQGVPPIEAKTGTKLARANFVCLMSGAPISGDHVKSEAKQGRLGARMLAIVADSPLGRVYLSPTENSEAIALQIEPNWKPEIEIAGSTQYIGCKPYGIDKFSGLFTNRQLIMLGVFSELVQEAHDRIKDDAFAAGLIADDSDSGTTAYADAVSLYLGEIVSKMTSYHCTLGLWRAPEGKTGRAFGRQAIQMVWDYPECNPFAGAGGDWDGACNDSAKVLSGLGRGIKGKVWQAAAQSSTHVSGVHRIISTDPPYYDNVPYADLADFFYVWLRHALKKYYPDIFSTMSVPKAEELVAFAHRHADKTSAGEFFMKGMTEAMHRLACDAHPSFPVAIYYAFRQSDTDENEGTASTGWETFLDAVLKAGFAVGGTWPMRTELGGALKTKRNALASSIVLICRKRPNDAPTISRREFVRELNVTLPEALDEMTKGTGEKHSPVAPVDLSQAIIGPGMAVFSKYSAVLEADGVPMSVRTALQLINRFLAEDDFDADTQWCLHWFEQHEWEQGLFGEADVLARAKATSVSGLGEAGVVESGSGKVRLLRWNEYPTDWNPRDDKRVPIWEALHQLIRSLKQGGESEAGKLLAAMKSKSEAVRQLAYRLYTLCERQGWAEDARAYNELVTSWSGIESAAGESGVSDQMKLFGDNE